MSMVILLLNALASLPLTASLSLSFSLSFIFATTGLISVVVRKVGLAEAACTLQPRGQADAAARPAH